MIYQGAKPVYQQLGKIKLIMYQKNVASVDNDTQMIKQSIHKITMLHIYDAMLKTNHNN